MEPGKLTGESFARYSPSGRALALQHIAILRSIPLSLLPVMLLQFQRYDVSFPMEKAQLETEIAGIESLSPGAFAAATRSFADLEPPSELAKMDWVNQPQQFTERLTAWLWSQHRIDEYHAAAERYRQAIPAPAAPSRPPRWTFVLIGREAPAPAKMLFRKLAPYGTLFNSVSPAHGTEVLLAEATARSEKYPVPYAHWYIDGADPIPVPGLTTMSYQRLVPAARKEFELLRRFTQNHIQSGPAVERATSYVASLSPDDLGVEGEPNDPLRFFEVSVLTQGAGCQIFSTTFVQWAARECLHRARPLTLVARFANRQMAAPMEQLLTRDPLTQVQDAAGSLVDADMGAYYTWINQARLPGNDQSRFVAWWEGHNVAVAISPTTARGVVSDSPCDMEQIVSWLK